MISMSEKEENKEKIITIRGIDKDLYKRALVIARKSGKTVGEVINSSLKMLISSIGTTSNVVSNILNEFQKGVKLATSIIISNLDELTITKKDLENIDKPIILSSIKRIVIDNDIPFDLFNSKVQSISDCDELVIPDNYPKLSVLSKCKFVKKVTYKVKQ